jgi:hypothetical protein
VNPEEKLHAIRLAIVNHDKRSLGICRIRMTTPEAMDHLIHEIMVLVGDPDTVCITHGMPSPHDECTEKIPFHYLAEAVPHLMELGVRL